MFVGKYSASGNDFVIFHTFKKQDQSALAKKICHRQNGIGADGLIVLLPHNAYDFEWQFYNSDGSEAHMCGNGSRAAALYAVQNNLANEQMRFLTLAGVIEASVHGQIVQTQLTNADILDKSITYKGKTWWLLDTGVPHLVNFSDSVESFDKEEARQIRNIYNANVNYASIAKDGKLLVRTYERGVEDETLACGTGMAACFVRANSEKMLGEESIVQPASKELLELKFDQGKLLFKGKVTHTFSAEYR